MLVCNRTCQYPTLTKGNLLKILVFSNFIEICNFCFLSFVCLSSFAFGWSRRRARLLFNGMSKQIFSLKDLPKISIGLDSASPRSLCALLQLHRPMLRRRRQSAHSSMKVVT